MYVAWTTSACTDTTCCTSTTATARSPIEPRNTVSTSTAIRRRRCSSTSTTTAIWTCTCSTTPCTRSTERERQRHASSAIRAPAIVSTETTAGIYGGALGYGLGVVASDFDGDGCMDLYVANDFQEDDFLYHNNCNGTFTEVGGKALRHTSRSSMGVDAADFNNDGRPDIISADMLPEREDIFKTSATVESF